MKHHYFVSTAHAHEAGTCLPAVLERVRKACVRYEGEYAVDVWKVPGPVKGSYRIEWSAPQVEGAELIDTFRLKVSEKLRIRWDEK